MVKIRRISEFQRRFSFQTSEENINDIYEQFLQFFKTVCGFFRKTSSFDIFVKRGKRGIFNCSVVLD